MPRYVRVQIAPQPPWILRLLVAVNVMVFLAWQSAAVTSQAAVAIMERHFLTSATAIGEGRVWTLLTSEVSHFDGPHLFFNLIALYTLGADVERVLGWRAFLHLYVGGAIVASTAHVAFDALTPGIMPALGASGAVMAVAVASAFLFPKRMLLLFFVIPMPQFVAVGLFVLFDLFGMFNPGGSQIAHAAHLGGALYGWIYQRWSMPGYLAARFDAIRRRRRFR